jgi:hypothetical protein
LSRDSTYGFEVVTIVIHANEHRETNFIAAPKADTALMSLGHLRDAYFILAARSSYGLYFAGCVQMQLQSAGLLSFSERSWHMKHYHLGFKMPLEEPDTDLVSL